MSSDSLHVAYPILEVLDKSFQCSCISNVVSGLGVPCGWVTTVSSEVSGSPEHIQYVNGPRNIFLSDFQPVHKSTKLQPTVLKMADPSQSDPGDATGTKEINSYSYSPLRVVTSKNTFRLLILMPEVEKNSPIKCTLTQELIENEPEYEALSYVWSALPGRSAIQVNNRTFFATKNLEAALRTLRRQKSVRILWIDAICINQDDQIEKQKQVQMMGEVRCLHHDEPDPY